MGKELMTDSTFIQKTLLNQAWWGDKAFHLIIAAIITAFIGIGTFYLGELIRHSLNRKEKLNNLYSFLILLYDELRTIRDLTIQCLDAVEKKTDELSLSNIDDKVFYLFIEMYLVDITNTCDKGRDLAKHLKNYSMGFLNCWNSKVARRDMLYKPSRHNNIIKTSDHIMRLIDNYVKEQFGKNMYSEFIEGRKEWEEPYFVMGDEDGDEIFGIMYVTDVAKDYIPNNLMPILGERPQVPF